MSGRGTFPDLCRVLACVLVIGGAIIVGVPQFVTLTSVQSFVLGIGAGAAGMVTGHAWNFALGQRDAKRQNAR